VSAAAADFVYAILGGVVVAMAAMWRYVINNRERLAKLEEWVRVQNGKR
jgi:hypothetical protein